MALSGKNRPGFTLIELMVVIVILGILSGYVGIRVIDRIHDGKLSRAKLDIATLETGLKLYRMDNDMYPNTAQGLLALVEKPVSVKKYRKGGYLEKGKVPKDPWGNDYVYLCPGIHSEFDIISYGADGMPEGDGRNKDVNNWELEG